MPEEKKKKKKGKPKPPLPNNLLKATICNSQEKE
jgi:hypothetical protein